MGTRVHRKVLTILSVLLSASVLAQEGSTRLTDDNIVFIYESRADIRTPDEWLARKISSDYRRANDEFTKYDLMQQIKPVLARRLNEARETQTVFLSIRGGLADYNFEKQSFPTGLGENTIIPYDDPYTLVFTNGSKMSELPVPLAQARTLSARLQKSRDVAYTVTGDIVGVEEGYMQRRSWGGETLAKQVKMNVTTLKVEFHDGAAIKTISF